MRIGSRERILSVAKKFPDRLRVECHALATRVLLDTEQRAIGVEYLKGERLYGAHANVTEGAGELRQARASREVILCGGAFNTPQLLMLSGISRAKNCCAIAPDSGDSRRRQGNSKIARVMSST
jgi:choline dehydrogenase-like flavoprotein